MGEKLVKQLPASIQKSGIIIKSNTDVKNADIVLVTNEQDQNGNPIIVAIKPDGNGYYNGINIVDNHVKSAYGKDNIHNMISNAYNEDRILFFDTLKSQKFMNIPRVQFPNNILTSDFTNNLARYKKIVNNIISESTQKDSDNTRHSIKDVDNYNKAKKERIEEIDNVLNEKEVVVSTVNKYERNGVTYYIGKSNKGNLMMVTEKEKALSNISKEKTEEFFRLNNTPFLEYHSCPCSILLSCAN